ncbi:MAG: hypothetical protein EP298_00095 [Gammaproteobacteria bacterium]|nr:MAG: hypothetical protein EP298_00095 [Gammaproteobacteria bacterium]UTW41593.1 hypothetical protein KFE69_08740 [bacterium SCSIO 12844]
MNEQEVRSYLADTLKKINQYNEILDNFINKYKSNSNSINLIESDFDDEYDGLKGYSTTVPSNEKRKRSSTVDLETLLLTDKDIHNDKKPLSKLVLSVQSKLEALKVQYTGFRKKSVNKHSFDQDDHIDFESGIDFYNKTKKELSFLDKKLSGDQEAPKYFSKYIDDFNYNSNEIKP